MTALASLSTPRRIASRASDSKTICLAMGFGGLGRRWGSGGRFGRPRWSCPGRRPRSMVEGRGGGRRGRGRSPDRVLPHGARPCRGHAAEAPRVGGPGPGASRSHARRWNGCRGQNSRVGPRWAACRAPAGGPSGSAPSAATVAEAVEGSRDGCRFDRGRSSLAQVARPVTERHRCSAGLHHLTDRDAPGIREGDSLHALMFLASAGHRSCPPTRLPAPEAKNNLFGDVLSNFRQEPPGAPGRS